MKTTPRRFKLFVTPGVLRWNRWGGQLIPAIDAYGVGLPPVRFSETWQYALNDMTTANTGGNWTVTTNIHTSPYAQMGNPAGQVNLSLSGFNTFSNNIGFVRGGANKGKAWAASLTFDSLSPGTAGDFGQGNGQQWTLGTQNGFTIVNSQASGVQLLHVAGGATGATINLGVNPSYAGTVLIRVNGASSRLYLNGVLKSSLTITPEVVGLTALQCQSNMLNGNAAGLGMVMRTVRLYGFP